MAFVEVFARQLSAHFSRHQVSAFCKQHSFPLHIDGARLGNAAVALGVPLARVAAEADTVTLCLSKGLGAPLGSVLAGSEAFIHRARFVRKLLGGGMRQAGFVAGTGLLALENVGRLHEDHSNAQTLASGIHKTASTLVEVLGQVETNIVMVRPTPAAINKLVGDAAGSAGDEDARVAQAAARIVQWLREDYGVLVGMADRRGVIRLVTHLDVNSGDMEYTVEAMGKLAAKVMG